MKKVSGIYCIENLVNGKKYIGQSVNISNRIKHHLWQLRNNIHVNDYLQRSWNKYGEESFRFFTLVELDSLEDRNTLEVQYINGLDTFSPNGYNTTKGGDGMTGFLFSDESKERMSLVKIGNQYSKGKTVSDETKYLISKANTGKRRSEEDKRKMSERNVGKVATLGFKETTSSSKFYGVCWKASDNKWRCNFTHNKKSIHVGMFLNEVDAALAYDKYIKDNNINRPLNFPDKIGT